MTADNPTSHSSTEYDTAIRQTIPFYEIIHSQTVSLIKTLKPQPKLWLDIGCGTGYLTELGLRSFPETEFVLADISEAMLGQAAKRLATSADRVKFLKATKNEALDDSARHMVPDVITAILCNHYLRPEGRRTATQKSYKLLIEGGLYVTFENFRPATDVAITVGLERWKSFQLAQGRPESVVEQHLRRFDSEFFPITIREHLNLLCEVGFRNPTLFWVSYMQAGFYAVR